MVQNVKPREALADQSLRQARSRKLRVERRREREGNAAGCDNSSKGHGTKILCIVAWSVSRRSHSQYSSSSSIDAIKWTITSAHRRYVAIRDSGAQAHSVRCGHCGCSVTLRCEFPSQKQQQQQIPEWMENKNKQINKHTPTRAKPTKQNLKLLQQTKQKAGIQLKSLMFTNKNTTTITTTYVSQATYLFIYCSNRIYRNTMNYVLFFIVCLYLSIKISTRKKNPPQIKAQYVEFCNLFKTNDIRERQKI